MMVKYIPPWEAEELLFGIRKFQRLRLSILDTFQTSATKCNMQRLRFHVQQSRYPPRNNLRSLSRDPLYKKNRDKIYDGRRDLKLLAFDSGVGGIRARNEMTPKRV